MVCQQKYNCAVRSTFCLLDGEFSALWNCISWCAYHALDYVCDLPLTLLAARSCQRSGVRSWLYPFLSPYRGGRISFSIDNTPAIDFVGSHALVDLPKVPSGDHPQLQATSDSIVNTTSNKKRGTTSSQSTHTRTSSTANHTAA